VELAIVALLLLASAYFLAFPRLYKAEIARKRARYEGYQPPRVTAIADELFNPSAHTALQVQEAHLVLPAPAPTPGDPPDLASGRIRISLRQAQ